MVAGRRRAHADDEAETEIDRREVRESDRRALHRRLGGVIPTPRRGFRGDSAYLRRARHLQPYSSVRTLIVMGVLGLTGCDTGENLPPPMVLAPQIPANVFETLKSPADAHAELC